MITFLTAHYNTYSQQNYDDDVNNIDFSNIRCTCGATGHFHYHASYRRYLIIDNNDEITIIIKRIKCDSCNKTHALLPSIIIPYRILSNPVVIRIIESYRHVTDSLSLLAKITGLSLECVKYLIKFYNKQHKERLLSLEAVFDKLHIGSEDFIRCYFFEYQLIFMQRILTGPHILL